MDNDKSNTITSFKNTKEFAKEMDQNDPMRKFRNEFHLPIQENGEPFVYLCGNSLGLQPKSTREAIEQELKDQHYQHHLL